MGLARCRIGVDVGGTFTDVTVLNCENGDLRIVKILTDVDEPWRSIIACIELGGIELRSVEHIVHATTLGSNLLLGQVGLVKPRIALITTKGFRDVFEIGRQNRPSLYNLFFEKPKPLVPRNMRFEVEERISTEGEIIKPLDVEGLRRIARKIKGLVDVVAIVFLHSYVNPVHEREARRILVEEGVSAEIILSSEVDPHPGEYERTSTTVVNAYLKPLLSNYLEKLLGELGEKGFNSKILVMQSSGGLTNISRAVETPVAFIESGPAAGAIAVAYYSNMYGHELSMGFDMGGTTAKASMIVEGDPLITLDYEVGGKVHSGRIVKGSGYPVRYPFIDLAEVSAGGGSIAWIDEGGTLRVGPMSAGSSPGPACYGRGGVEPTITDANLVLGRLSRILAGGEIVADESLARKAIGKIASKLSLSIEEAAYGIIKIANTLMSKALRIVSIERGIDPRKATLYAFGGAGPLHAAEIAVELGVREIIVPKNPGAFSAFGLLVADYRVDLSAPYLKPLREESLLEVAELLEKLSMRGTKAVLEEGASESNIKVVGMLDLRYRGERSSLTIPYVENYNALLDVFHRKHLETYGFRSEEEEVIVDTVKVTVIGITDKPVMPRRRVEEHRPVATGFRRIFDGYNWIDSSVYSRSMLKPGALLKGPSIIESYDSTIYVPEGFTAVVDEYESIRITCR